MIRINGDPRIGHPAMAREEVHGLVYDLMNDGQRKTFEETHECDFSFELGLVARFRVNVFCSVKARRSFPDYADQDHNARRLGHAADVAADMQQRKGLIR